ncbi:putative membrane protein [Minicystis rosea]|nr:putative membrane protein [Minicystis rosea]
MDALDFARMWRPEHHPLETVMRAAVAYAFVHISFRVVGRKELGRNATYEIVLLLFVSVAMRQTIVGNDSSLTTGLIGFTTMVAIDALVAWIVRHSPRAAQIIDGPVREIVRDGRPDERAMKKARVTREQLGAALRDHGHEHIEEVHRACLERSGRISIVFRRPPSVRRRRRRARYARPR